MPRKQQQGAEIEEASYHSPLPLPQRPEWAGTPSRPLPPAALRVVAPAPPDERGDLMDYFWAAVEAGERSERVLALTEEIIRHLNSSHYSVWEWRWRCLEALGGAAARAVEERALMRAVATENPKNYQLWNVRRRLALALGPAVAEEELEFAAACLTYDSKNYHAWAHRQAVLSALAADFPALWRDELSYTERLLRADVRNNSAWSQRRFVLAAAPPGALPPPAEAWSEEVDFTCGRLRLAPNNEAAWAYLRGLCSGRDGSSDPDGSGLRGAPPRALAAEPRVLSACRQALEAHPSCAPALALLAEVLAEAAAVLEESAGAATDNTGEPQGGGPIHDAGGGAGSAQGTGRSGSVARWREAAGRARTDVANALSKLAVVDPLRRGYWQHQQNQLAVT